MPTLTDTFPAPSLDATRWTSVLAGSGAVTIGVPSDGIHVTGVDDDGDSIVVHSDAKIYIPAGQAFDMSIEYNDIGADAQQVLCAFLGWRSVIKDGLGNPLYGVDLILCKYPGGTIRYEKRTTSLGTVIWTPLIADPNAGANSKFRIVRLGFTYSLYYWDTTLASPDWVKVANIVHSDNSAGFAYFGYFATDPEFPVFPWIVSG